MKHNQPRFQQAYSPVTPVNIGPFPDGQTEQSHKAECDINNILKRFQQTGIIDHINEHAEHYGDITSSDFQTAMNTVATANSMFADLPSSVREKFQNSPEQFFDYVQDPQNIDNLVEMGLAHPPQDIPPVVSAETPTETSTTPTETTS